MALISCRICTVSGMFLKSSGEIQPDLVDVPTTNSNNIIVSKPCAFIGRGMKLLNCTNKYI